MISKSGKKQVQWADEQVAAPTKLKRGVKRTAEKEMLDMLGGMHQVTKEARYPNNSTRAAVRAAAAPVAAPRIEPASLVPPWCVYTMHEENWALSFLPIDFMTATIALHKRSCEVLASKQTKPEDNIANKYSLLTTEIDYKRDGQCEPAYLVMNPGSMEFVAGESAPGSGFATTDAVENDMHYSRCFLCKAPDYRMRSGSYRNGQPSDLGDINSWYPKTHDQPNRDPEVLQCSYSTFIPSFCKVRDENLNEDRYGVHREDYYIKLKYHYFSADVDKQVTRVIMDLLPQIKDMLAEATPDICDSSNAFLLYDATGGYADRMVHAWYHGGILSNTIHHAADQVVLNFMTEDGHKALSEFACDGFKSNDDWLIYRWFAPVGLQPCAPHQTEAMFDVLIQNKTCTHACIVLYCEASQISIWD